MSIWGIDIFEGDRALDVLREYMQADPTELEELFLQAFEEAADIDDMDLDECSYVMVAAAVLDAVKNGHAYNVDDENFEIWLSTLMFEDFSTEVYKKAIPALETMIAGCSEVVGSSSDECSSNEEWKDQILAMITRLDQ